MGGVVSRKDQEVHFFVVLQYCDAQLYYLCMLLLITGAVYDRFGIRFGMREKRQKILE